MRWATFAALCPVCLVPKLFSLSDDGLEIDGKIRTKVGPISAAFSGKGKMTRNDATHTGQVEGGGADRTSSSRVKLTMVYVSVASADGKSTTTDVVAKVILTGPLAQFGKGSLMNDIAAAMTAEFTDNFAKSFDTPTTVVNGNGNETMAPATPLAPAELRPMKLLWIVIKARFARLLGSSKA